MRDLGCAMAEDPQKRRAEDSASSPGSAKKLRSDEDAVFGAAAAASADSNCDTCCKCGCPMGGKASGSLGSKRSKQLVHPACTTAYKRRMRHNKKSKAMERAWQAMSEKERQDWFVKNSVQELEVSDNDMEHDTAVTEEAATDRMVRNVAIPYWKFEAEHEMRGWAADRIKAEWRRMLLDKNYQKVREQGEICIVRFEGVILDDRHTGATSSSFKATSKVTNAGEKDEAKKRGTQAVAKARAAAKQVREALSSRAWESDQVKIPDELIDNLVEGDEVAEELAGTLAGMEDSVFATMLAAETKRQELLEALMQQDLLDASVYMATLDQAEEEETQAVIDKFRVSKASEFNRCKEIYSLACQQLKCEVKHVVELANRLFGADNQSVAEPLGVLANADASLDALEAACARDIDGLRTQFNDAKTTAEMRKKLTDLKTTKSDKMREQQGLRSAMIALRSQIRKKEAGDLKGVSKSKNKGKANKASAAEVKENGEDMANTHASVLQHFVNHVVPTQGKSLNMSTSTDGFDRLTPVCVTDASIHTELKQIKFVDVLVRWVVSQLGSKDTTGAALEKPKHFEKIQEVLAKFVGAAAFEKPCSVLHAWLSEVFCIGIQCCTNKYTSPGFMPYGLGQWFVPFKGSIMLLGIKIEAVPGMAFSEKVQKVSTMRPDDITKLVKESGFYVQCEAGDAAFMPPGFLILVLALEESAWFKWSTLSNDLHGGHPELRHVLSSTTMMISSFPVLQASYKDWVRYLEVAARTPSSSNTT